LRYAPKWSVRYAPKWSDSRSAWGLPRIKKRVIMLVERLGDEAMRPDRVMIIY
jgi:hypothetical protein